MLSLEKRKLLATKEGIDGMCWLEKDGYLYGPNYCGYTRQPHRAGVYPREHAEAHVRGCSGEVKAVPIPAPQYRTMEELNKVFSTLSDAEWQAFVRTLCRRDKHLLPISKQTTFRRLLTMPPEEIAGALADSLESVEDLLQNIRHAAARIFSISIEEIRSRTRKYAAKDARQAVWYVLRERGMLLEEIAELDGGRHHTTIMHGIAALKDRMDTEPALREKVLALQEMVDR